TTIDQVIERIHVDDELIEAKKTLIIGIQAPSEILSSTNNIGKEVSPSIQHQTEKSFDIVSNKNIDNIDLPICRAYSNDKTVDTIIITTEEVLPIDSSKYCPMSNIQIDSVSIRQDTLTCEQTSVTYRTAMNDKLPSDLLESLSVPAQLDLLPLATM
ncbi:unnamed protein product, partial [Rotaria magnacalcarata]